MEMEIRVLNNRYPHHPNINFGLIFLLSPVSDSSIFTKGAGKPTHLCVGECQFGGKTISKNEP